LAAPRSTRKSGSERSARCRWDKAAPTPKKKRQRQEKERQAATSRRESPQAKNSDAVRPEAADHEEGLDRCRGDTRRSHAGQSLAQRTIPPAKWTSAASASRQPRRHTYPVASSCHPEGFTTPGQRNELGNAPPRRGANESRSAFQNFERSGRDRPADEKGRKERLARVDREKNAAT